ncbi:MAG: 30S ribosome-binding factor RbfA [Rhodovarius sp.]|nr:30S ribosome-binding factor RbfA [Rhodovarius sp.]MCX7931207.1 30S ribosome-binding factor RbfA [Rhodovarius sp.]MDW8314037.1 30S ribosome-binding factor RbfA [Rhodovarius sp.]
MTGRKGSGQAAGPSQRQLRVAEEVRHALAAVFTRAEFRDPALADQRITVTEVRASPDLRHMTAFVSNLGQAVTADQLAALHRAEPYIRGLVARAVRLKFAPEMHFRPDTALEQAQRLNALLNSPAVKRDLGG